ncbi:peptidylprolyl isomerase [Dechloromonas sp. A34]|uniref:peptidylprolyl isomerase n=1 Tax=Dechloromonas sp. A34 TaxID=447588 RepID=UPI002248C560|nr:peptidylprolyl isomerase [Dechloromonas sp. A34]
MKICFSVRRPRRVVMVALIAGLPLISGAQDVAPVATVPTEAKAVQAAPHQNSHGNIFAIINGREILTEDYEAAFTTLVRQRFYHGQIPEAELVGVREEIKTKLVQRVVLLEEAERRKIAPDDNQIQETIASYEKRYATSPQWQENRERLLPDLKKQLAEQSQIALLDKQVRAVPEPDEKAVRAFYEKNPQLFVEPEKIRLAVILLAVDPSSPATAWQATREEAQAIYGRLSAGADYDEAARMHSSVYADKGGDMGYLHRGMLPETIQDKIDKFEVGKINEPMDTLEGVAIFKLLERVVAKKRDFADVENRARELLIRERQDKAWKDLIDRLVAKAKVKFMYFSTAEQRETGKN